MASRVTALGCDEAAKSIGGNLVDARAYRVAWRCSGQNFSRYGLSVDRTSTLAGLPRRGSRHVRAPKHVH
jgi:hypothetical protein